MGAVFDLEKSILSLKANEKMIAFAGFTMHPEGTVPGQEGILKISAFYRADGSGYLTLTFLVDTGESPSVRDRLSHLIKGLAQETLQPYLGKELEMVVEVPLDTMAHRHDYFYGELNLYFRAIRGRERVLIEGKLVPGLAAALHCSFEPVEWIGEEEARPAPPAAAVEGPKPPAELQSFASRLRGWFKS